MRSAGIAMALTAVFALAACDGDETADVPKPAELTRDDISHFGRMIVQNHKGPKGQIHLKDHRKPLWFSSVRDTIAFTMLPGESKRVAAVYVNDMTRASWQRPEPGTWIDARAASYVIGSRRRGGMGAPEAVPFAKRDAAAKFATKYGGRVVGFGDIPRDYILGSSGSMAQPGRGKDAKPGGHRTGGRETNGHMKK
jgi:copper chaperone NosL